MTKILERLLGRMPIGWKQLSHHRSRLFMALGGVAFANVLIFMQLGFMNALFESAVVIHHRFEADIVLASSDLLTLREANPLPAARSMEALGVHGVKDATSVFIGILSWTDQETGDTSNFRVIGVDPDKRTFVSDSLHEAVPALKECGSAILDRLMRQFPQAIDTSLREKGYFDMEASGRMTRVVGLFELGASFDVDGSLVVSHQSFFRLFPNRSASTPNLVLIRCLPGFDPERVARGIDAAFSESDTKAWTKQEFVDAEMEYQLKFSPIGFVFGFGVGMGIIVGLMIVYQVLASDVADHLAEYATLKAIGYRTSYFVGIVIEEAICISTFGFLPGLGISMLLYGLTADATDLPIAMSWSRTAFVFLLTFGMCAISGILATRKLKSADPAELF